MQAIELDLKTLNGKVEILFDELAQFVPDYMSQHQRLPQFALPKRFSVAEMFPNVVTSGDRQNFMCLQSNTRELLPDFNIMAAPPRHERWGEVLCLSSARFHLPAADRFGLAISTTISPVADDMDDRLDRHQNIIVMRGSRTPVSLLVDDLRAGNDVYEVTPNRVNRALEIMLIGTAYALETVEKGIASEDYLHHMAERAHAAFGPAA